LESGATLRTSIGVGTGDSPQFTNLTATGTINGLIGPNSATPSAAVPIALPNEDYLAWHDSGTSGGTTAYMRGAAGVLNFGGSSYTFNGTGAATFGGNLTVTGEPTFGPGGTGTDVVNVIANGGSGAAGGAVFEVRSNGAYRGGLGNEAAINGSGTSNDIHLRTASGADIVFAPNNVNSLTLASAGTATFAGSVGVGVAPGNLLDLKSGTQYQGLRLNNASNVVAELLGFGSGNDAGGLKLREGGTAKVELYANGTSHFGGGDVGIGTSSVYANSKFEVSSGATVLPTVTVTADAAVTAWRLRRTGGSHAHEYYVGMRENTTTLDIYDNTRNTSVFSIAGGGGATTLSGDTVTIHAGAQNRMLHMGTTGTAGGTAIQMLESARYNWQISSSFLVSNDFEITPSSASGNSTFSAAALKIAAATKATTLGGALTVNGAAEFTQALNGSAQILRVKNNHVGNSSPARLIVQTRGWTDSDAVINLDAAATNARWTLGADAAAGKFVIANADLNNFTGSSEVFQIDGASGGVGIGTAGDSTYALKVTKAGANSYQQLYGATGYAAEMHLSSQAASGTFVLAMDNAGTAKIGTNINTPLLFQTNNAERARISNSGNISVGNTSPEAKLDISGDTVLRSSGSNTDGRYWQYVRALGNDPTNVDIVDITLPNYCTASVKVRVTGRGGAALATQFHSEQTYAITTDTSSANVHAGTQVNIDQSFTLTTTVSSQNVTIDVTASSVGNVNAYVEILSSAALTDGL